MSVFDEVKQFTRLGSESSYHTISPSRDNGSSITHEFEAVAGTGLRHQLILKLNPEELSLIFCVVNFNFISTHACKHLTEPFRENNTANFAIKSLTELTLGFDWFVSTKT
jgi:hypothetical protein